MLAAPALQHGFWGVLVRSLANDETLYSVNAGKLFMPASNMKIVTLAAAADRLGWDYRYDTRLFASAPVADGVLRGDLLVVGSGDPSIVDSADPSARVFDQWAERLAAGGLRRIDGRLVADGRAFQGERLGAGWTWDDLAEGYAAGIGGLQYNENQVRATIAPGLAVGDAVIVSLEPAASGLLLHNELTTTPADTAASVEARRLPGSNDVELRGSVPMGSAPRVRALSVDNPALFFASVLRHTLIAHGIDVRGPAVDAGDLRDAPSRERATLLLQHRSPPLSELGIALMKISLNYDAETFLKTMGAVEGTPTIDRGREAVRPIVEGWGVEAGGLIMRDGSGLSRYNYVTPATLVAILTHVDRDRRLRDPFVATLPIAGRDGTLARRMAGTRAENNARAKTGSLSNARALSGFVNTADGEPLVFSILANNFDTAAPLIEQTADAIVVRLAEFSRR